MKGFTHSLRWFTAAVLLCAMPATSAFAQVKTTPATDKNTNVAAVPRAIPDLVPYHVFDPPKNPLFDINKLTVSGDIRVRPEFRTNSVFGVGHADSKTPGSLTTGQKQNSFFTQQLIRLGFNYDISPDVVFFVQAQVSNNFGATQPGISDKAGISDKDGGVSTSVNNPQDTAQRFFLRQGFIMVRNFVIPNLSLKAGRQLMVWGNHRIFGHFDWSNVGFAFDGVTFRYNHKMFPVETGWLRVGEGDCTQNATLCDRTGKASNDGDIVFVRIPAKIAGIAIEPAWIWESGGSSGSGIGTNNTGAAVGGQPGNQSRHTVGARIATKKGMFDATAEGYWQFGQIGVGGFQRDLTINALAGHFDFGVTLPVPMQPRIGAEVNYATGDGDNKNCQNVTSAATQVATCGGNANTFSQLFPTNHINWGYMDLMSWQNMLTYAFNLQLRPTKNSHFELAGHIMHLASANDHWYTASQGILFNAAQNAAGAKSIGQEIDAVYTLFFQGNKVAWQIGYGHFFPGALINNNVTGDPPGSDWGYTQLWINF
ncbi:MAG: hypothetical protein D6690_05475 [Nitrospirae bacterium]|nr:MAG: hypothetical protein D6690_05475 [Nitrospirota bacterium]